MCGNPAVPHTIAMIREYVYSNEYGLAFSADKPAAFAAFVVNGPNGEIHDASAGAFSGSGFRFIVVAPKLDRYSATSIFRAEGQATIKSSCLISVTYAFWSSAS